MALTKKLRSLKKKGQEACICNPSMTLSLFKDPVAPSLHQALEFYIVLVFVLASGKDLYLGLGKHGCFLHSVTYDECWMS